MAQSRNNRISQAQQVLDHLTADKKKTAFAVSLLAVMGFMWFRVLTGHQPGPVAAETRSGQEQSKLQKPPRNIRYLELPNLPGRNDYINRDFFASRDGVLPNPALAAGSRANDCAWINSRSGCRPGRPDWRPSSRRNPGLHQRSVGRPRIDSPSVTTRHMRI
jgi:hypothetical protein